MRESNSWSAYYILPIIDRLRSGQQPRKHISKKKKQKRIQNAFYNKLGLRIDIVKQGFGSFNNGNTSRQFLADPKTTAEITGVDKELIRKFSTSNQ